MINDLAQEAIKAALSGNWNSAVELNLQILQKNFNNVDALNRLARAYAELGYLKKARDTAQEALKTDPFNTIATKALEKWKGLKKGETYVSRPSNPQLFLEEPGKTKIVCLIHLGSPKVLAKLDSGDEVKLNTHSHRVSITTFDGDYIGRLPDNLSARIRNFINMGNEYQVFVKSVDKSEVKMFIRETKKAASMADIPSFSSDKIDYVSFTPPELVHKKDDMEMAEEGEE